MADRRADPGYPPPLALLLPLREPAPPESTGRAVGRWILILAYLFAGIAHLRTPSFFLPIMPGWVPFPRETILATGACELAGAVGLMTRRFRYAAGCGLALYALCVFPANIKHAIDDLRSATGLPWTYHVPRLLLQAPIIWWALFSGGVTNWPLEKR